MENVQFKQPRTLKDIRQLPFVESIHREHDGAFAEQDNPKGNYWVYLKQGYISNYMECGTIHEPTVKDLVDVFNEGISIGKGTGEK